MRAAGVSADTVVYATPRQMSSAQHNARLAFLSRAVSSATRVHCLDCVPAPTFTPGWAPACRYNSALTACARNRPPQWRPARQLLRNMKRWGIERTTVSYNAALAAAAAARNARAARRLLEAMAEEGARADVASYGTTIAACERARDWRGAVAVLRQAQAADCADLDCFNSAISAVARGRGSRHALAMVREVRAAGLQPNARTFGPVLLASRRQPRLILDLLETEIAPRKLRLDAFAGSAVISAIGATKQWNRALQALELVDKVRVLLMCR